MGEYKTKSLTMKTKEAFERTERLLGGEAMERLASCRVAVFGVGGVGGFCVEALARSGVGALELVDSDVVSASNLNRQIIATVSSLGRKKVEVAKERIGDINPDCKVTVREEFVLPATIDTFDFSAYDYVVDAIDTIAGKLAIIQAAKDAGVPVISAMGAGNKLDGSAFKVADIYETRICPLAKVIRKECKKRGIDSLKVVYSEEEPVGPAADVTTGGVADSETEAAATAAGGVSDSTGGVFVSTKKRVPGSVAFVPSVMGLIIAGEVVKDLVDSLPRNAF